MGRFATTVEFYARYREPYSARFFQQVSTQLEFKGTESLLDVGCGPGLLAIGFAPYVRQCTGIDPEPAMLEAAAKTIAKAGVAVSLMAGRLEDFKAPEKFDIITIGRALHWLDRANALSKLNELLSDDGAILICGATSVETSNSTWVPAFNSARKEYAIEPDASRYRIDPRSWFGDSPFSHREDVSVAETRPVEIDELIGRALSRSNTSPEVLGKRRVEFEGNIRATLQPYSEHGQLEEEIVARASVFQRTRIA